MEFKIFDWWNENMSREDCIKELFNQRELELLKDDETVKMEKIKKYLKKENQRKELLNSIQPSLELKSRYRNVSSYYYSYKDCKIYEIENSKYELKIPEKDVYIKIQSENSFCILAFRIKQYFGCI